jgi:mono/diheme cytochrome c family protein
MKGWVVMLLCSGTTLAGCERGMHEMYDQAKYLPLTPSTLFADGNSSRPQVAGTVPYSGGSAADASSGRNGALAAPPAAGPGLVLGADGRSLLPQEATASGYANPLPITLDLLARGRDRFNIYCSPCHGELGDGRGMIVERGFPAPPSYHTDRLRGAPDRHFFDVITAGYGAMYPYADRIAPQDRWAITAYVRALQLSQHVPAAWLSAAERQQLREPQR